MKLRLKVDDLRVTSFAASEATKERGTVRAHDTYSCETPISCDDTCGLTCHAETCGLTCLGTCEATGPCC